MLSFSAEFPVNSTKSSADFFISIQQWILGSPHTSFKITDLDALGQNDDFCVTSGDERLEALNFIEDSTDAAALRYTKMDKGLEWISTIVYFKDTDSSWVSVRVACHSPHPTVSLPIARKPIVVQSIFNFLGGAIDGELQTSDTPHRLSNSDISLAAKLVTGVSGCRLPIIYISTRFKGGHLLDADSLARALAGMAHVVVEPNRAFSLRLMQEVSGQNVYGGAVGIYWPGGGTGRSILFAGATISAKEGEKIVAEEVRVALINRRPRSHNTWSAVQEKVSQRKYKKLLADGSTDFELYATEFDKEIESKNIELEEANREIARLEAAVRKYQAQVPMQSGIRIQTIGEQDLYPGEIFDIVLESLADSLSRNGADTRRTHILESIRTSNVPVGEGASIKERLKNLLRDYKSMDAKLRSEIVALGFDVDDQSKHYWLTFQGDPRYTFAMSKTSSDHKAGSNLSHDIARKIL